MKQINSDQIIDNGIAENTVKPIPRDLADVKSASSGKSGMGSINTRTPTSDSGGSSFYDGEVATPVSSPKPLPDTPALIGIKSQSVKIKDDGTYAVDVIIDIEDIRGVSDYEVRISKSAGTI